MEMLISIVLSIWTIALIYTTYNVVDAIKTKKINSKLEYEYYSNIDNKVVKVLDAYYNKTPLYIGETEVVYDIFSVEIDLRRRNYKNIRVKGFDNPANKRSYDNRFSSLIWIDNKCLFTSEEERDAYYVDKKLKEIDLLLKK
jgi:hypothetical protein